MAGRLRRSRPVDRAVRRRNSCVRDISVPAGRTGSPAIARAGAGCRARRCRDAPTGSWLSLLARSPWASPYSFRSERRPPRVVLQQFARDHDLLHLGRAFVDAQRPDLAIKLLDLDALLDAEPAVQLDGAI